MTQHALRFRQVHLDFHTSEQIPGIGADFDPAEFAETLEKARVNSITCFARCHHGYVYFDSVKHPERRHPHLTRNLLQEQIEACHSRDIRVPIYITVQWDHFTAEEHPEWLCVGADGRLQGTAPYDAGFYRRLCLNSPYVSFLHAHVQEVLETFPTDGIFFDIVQAQDCSCANCRKGMAAAGIDASDVQARQAYGTSVVNRFELEMTEFVRRFNADCTIFYNAGHVGPRHRPVVSAFTHFELESLPSGGWGYLHFPLTQRYARNLGADCLGMTGKFHTSWGDFHSFKNRAALEFECFQMLALNAKCSVGDQLHPTGKICPVTYDLIGSVYRQVEEKEPWCAGAQAVTEIGVLTPEEQTGGGYGALPAAAIGAVRILQEGAHQFDIIDSQSDFGAYKLLILPDRIRLNSELTAKIETYLANGGCVIATHESGLTPSGDDFASPCLGVTKKGEAPFSPDFIVPRGDIGKGLPSTEHVMYLHGLEVAAGPDAEVLAEVVVPYFNRTHQHFCSHRHTPSSGNVSYAGVVRNGSAIYFAHPMFTQYARNAPRWCKQLVLNAIDMLLPAPLIEIEAPSTVITAVNEQTAERRYVLHLLHYIPGRRGEAFDVLEDVIPIHDVRVSARLPQSIRAVETAPEQVPLYFRKTEDRIDFAVPCLAGHQMVALIWED